MIIECLKLNFTANEVDGRELWQNFSGKKFQITEMRGFIERLNRVDACLVPVPYDVFYKGEEDLACTLLSNFGGNLMILRNYITKTVIQHNDGTSFMVYSLCDIPISLESTLYEARFADIQPIYLEESAYSKFLEDAPHTLDLVSILTQELPSCLC